MKKKIFICVLIYICVFCYSFFFSTVFGDEIWNYGFSYNIFKGLIPYRDFNMVITPMYSFIVSFFIKFFGTYLISLHIANSFIVVAIFYYLYRMIGKRAWLVFPLVIIESYPSYNVLCLLVLFMILFLNESKNIYKDILIGFLVGVMFLTKQTVGILFLIPMIYYSKSRLKSIICFFIPVVLFIVYLIYYDALYSFIDYCFLGLFDFGKNNTILLFLPLEVGSVLFLGYHFLKSKFQNRNVFYILMFQVIVVPIFDDYHFMLGFIPVFFFFFSIVSFQEFRFKYFVIIVWVICFYSSIIFHFESLNYVMNKSSFLYGRNIPKYIEKSVNRIGSYIKDKKDAYDYVYFFSANAYFVKLSIDYPISKYDMINNGNMGYHGDIKYINEIDTFCSSHKCMFLLYHYEDEVMTQTNKTIVNYVKDTYDKYDKFDVFDVYVN